MSSGLLGPEEIAAIRDEATRAWQDSFGDLEAGWQVVPLDLGPVLAPFDVTIDPRWDLLVLAVRWGRDGEGTTVAVPAERAPDVRAEVESRLRDWEKDETPRISESADDVGIALSGERSPRGLLLASLAVRELAEIGASGHGRSWLDEQVVGGSGPLPDLGADWGQPRDPMEWTWAGDSVFAWDPTVSSDPEGPEVVFYTYDPVGSHHLLRHTDRYGPAGLAAVRSREVVAEAAGGITP